MRRSIENTDVLYVVNEGGPTSIPLELADVIDAEDVDLTVAVFKESGDTNDHFDRPAIPLGSRFLCDPRGIWNLLQCIAEFQPDIIHVHHTASAFWGSILAKLVADVAIVRTEHNNQRHYSIPQNVLHGCSQLLADRILCNSENTYHNLYGLQKWAVGDKWKVVYNGVDVSRIEAASDQTPSFYSETFDDRTLIGSVGRLVDQKNYRRLIGAFSLVLEAVPEAHLILIGDGENQSELRREVEAQGVEKRITFAGECPRDDVYAALHEFDLFVMPSLWEGFCNAVVEAMAAGLPIVSSDISTLREVIGDVAVYVEPEDTEDIASGIVEVLSEKGGKRGYSSRQRAMENYSIEKASEAYAENYYRVLEQRKSEVVMSK